MLRSCRLLAKSHHNRLNKFDWKPYREEVFGPRLKPDPAASVPRKQHTFIPEREADEIAQRPLIKFPGKPRAARLLFSLLTPSARQ